MSKQYTIVTAFEITTFEELVVAKLNKGWICQGGISTIRDGSLTKYYQAMVNREAANWR